MKQVTPIHNFKYADAELNIYYADKGYGLNKHQHTFPHATFCQSGSCLIKVNNKEIVLTLDSQPIELPANIPHEIEALEDKTVFINLFKIGQY